MTPDDERYPEKLLEISNFPLVLYYYGNADALKNRLTISVVGTRNATQTGMALSYRLANALAKSGVVVVSGGAKGIDGAAHLGALDADGETVAVLGCGFLAKYHDSAENLKEEILKKGLIITEYPPDTRAYGRNFPVRNRILSALSYGVVVAESPAKSGSLITAKYAAEHGRDLFAIVGNVVDSDMTGTIGLIRDDGATAVYSCYDILSNFEFIYPHLLDYNKIDSSLIHEFTGEIDFSKVICKDSAKKKIAEPSKSDEGCPKKEKEIINKALQLTGNAKTVYDALADAPMHIDDILRKIPSLTVGKIMVSLTQLEMKGLVISDSGKKYSRK